jgi:hypothetical protein
MPQTPDSFPGVRIDEGIILTDDGYGVPGTRGEIRFSNNRFWIRDGYMVFDVRTHVEPHISSHLGDGSDTFYVISTIAPTINEDINDGYEVGLRWINTTDGYEYVLIDNSPGAADWKNTTIGDAGGGITADEHKILRQLIHFIDEGPGGGFASGAYKEILPAANPFPTQTIWWESSLKLQKIVEKNITRNANQTPATIQWKMYDTDGSTVLETVTDTITYSGVFEISRTRSIS